MQRGGSGTGRDPDHTAPVGGGRCEIGLLAHFRPLTPEEQQPEEGGVRGGAQRRIGLTSPTKGARTTWGNVEKFYL